MSSNKTIPKILKELVWTTYIGDKLRCMCPICGIKEITAFAFECAHVNAEACGGKTVLENLRSICKSCNSSMGIKNMKKFCMDNFPKAEILKTFTLSDEHKVLQLDTSRLEIKSSLKTAMDMNDESKSKKTASISLNYKFNTIYNSTQITKAIALKFAQENKLHLIQYNDKDDKYRYMCSDTLDNVILAFDDVHEKFIRKGSTIIGSDPLSIVSVLLADISLNDLVIWQLRDKYPRSWFRGDM